MLTARSVVAATVGIALVSIILAGLSLLRPPDSGGLGGDSYGTRAHGQRAVMETLAEMNVPVRRRLGPPLPPPDPGCTLVFWAPHQNLVSLEPAYLEEIAEWVRGGGRVVVAPPRVDSEPRQRGFRPPAPDSDEETSILEELGLLGVTARPLEEIRQEERKEDGSEHSDDDWVGGQPREDRQEEVDEDSFDAFRETWGEAWSTEPVPTAPVSVQARGALAELGRSVAAVELPQRGLQVLDVADSKPAGSVTFTDDAGAQRTLVAVYRLGSGEVVVVAEPALLENRLIARQDNSVLAAHLLAGGGQAVVFEEFYHGLTIRGNPLWLLSRQGFAVVAVGILVVLGLWIWRQSTSLGPPPAPAPTPRRSIGEYVEAMARFLKKGRASGRFLLQEVRDGVLRDVRQELGLPPGREAAEDLVAALQRRDPRRAEQLIQAVAVVDQTLSTTARRSEKQTFHALRRILDCLSIHDTKPSAVKSPR
ncbi:MAG: hypothetical protein HQ581_15565 [Planctomycetes bacterium]|nr:hypothetical protein [Planctomycetota bacterium]